MPVSGTIQRLEDQDVELAGQDVKNSWPSPCTCAPTSKPGRTTTSNVEISAPSLPATLRVASMPPPTIRRPPSGASAIPSALCIPP